MIYIPIKKYLCWHYHATNNHIEITTNNDQYIDMKIAEDKWNNQFYLSKYFSEI